MRRELLLGSGVNRQKRFAEVGREMWENLTTLDINPEVAPDVIHDLNRLPLPFEANHFDEIHAYHVLEHVGAQGDYRFFFAQWEDFWRILKPDGQFVGETPAWHCEWAWADPGHTRVITPSSLLFLSQKEYEKWVGRTVMCDYRFCYKADFKLIHYQEDPDGQQYQFVLQALKG